VTAAAVRVLVVGTLLFSALGWIVAGILDLTGVLSLTDALFVVAAAVGLIAGLLMLESSDVPVSMTMRAVTMLSVVEGDIDSGTSVPVTQRQALAIAAAALAAVGLAIVAVFVG